MTARSEVPPDSPATPGPLARLRAALGRALSVALILAGIVLLLNLDTLLGANSGLPMEGEQLSYALLFVAGLFTGFHCMGMCGALVVGYVVKAGAAGGSKYLTHVYYGLGKTLSYTGIGGLFGALGAIVTFTPFMRGVAGIGAGVFLLLFGLSTVNVFPALARFRIKTPAFVMKRLGTAYRNNGHPFAIGLLNGLMIICGPLQAMYILAAGTGSPVEGAKMLFVFGLGTLPMMLGFGVLASALSRQFAPKIVRASGIIVIGLGVIMLNRGLALVGGGYDYQSLIARWRPAAEAPAAMAHDPGGHGGHDMAAAPAGHEGHVMIPAPAAPRVTEQVIRMTADAGGYTPRSFTLRKGVPVLWIIQGEELNYCNHRIVVPALNLEFDVRRGENRVRFTPDRVGVIPWSCWMGMIQGQFLVHEDPALPPSPHPAPSPPTNPLAALHDHGHGSAPAEPPPQWLKGLLERSAEGIEALRRSLRP